MQAWCPPTGRSGKWGLSPFSPYHPTFRTTPTTTPSTRALRTKIGFIVGVGRLQADAVLLGEPAFQRGLALVGHGHDDLALAGGPLLLDDHVVAVGDLVLDHRLAVDLQHEEVLVGRIEHLVEIDPLVLLDGLVQHAGGDAAGQRQAALVDRLGRQLDRPRHVRLAGDQPLLLQGLQVADHAVGRVDVEFGADLADRRPVAAAADLVANELVDRLLPFGQFVE